MRILLTGSSGYIGRKLAPRLKQEGHEIVGIDRARAENAALDRFIECDLLQPEYYADAAREADLICHLAAAKGDWGISDAEYHRDNVEATRSLIETARGGRAKQWLFYSTVSVLGPSRAPLDENASPRPTNAYGRSKAACEQMLRSYAEEEADIQVIALRPSVVFGPDNPWNTNIFRLIDAIYRNRFLMIGRGAEVKTTSYIENLIDAHMHLIRRRAGIGRGMEIFHYVDSPAESTAALVDNIYNVLEKKRPKLRLPLGLASPIALAGDAAAALTGVDLPITSARVRKFCTATNFAAEKIRALGYEQRIPNELALRRTIDWYLATKANSSRKEQA